MYLLFLLKLNTKYRKNNLKYIVMAFALTFLLGSISNNISLGVIGRVPAGFHSNGGTPNGGNLPKKDTRSPCEKYLHLSAEQCLNICLTGAAVECQLNHALCEKGHCESDVKDCMNSRTATCKGEGIRSGTSGDGTLGTGGSGLGSPQGTVTVKEGLPGDPGIDSGESLGSSGQGGTGGPHPGCDEGIRNDCHSVN